ncbi:DUF2207 domain-containing protein [Actinomycetota bacterium]
MRRAAQGAPAVLVALLAMAMITLGGGPARAAEESVRSLDASFDVQPDGSIKVRYELDWFFGERGRHGIKFGIATRESWEKDTSQDVVYDVSDIQVDSPSGAPDAVALSDTGSGSEQAISVRIGSESETIKGKDARYVITYTLRGAMRTFDGVPELFWDVTSPDYPPIEKYSMRVTAPKGVTRARCLAGSQTCEAKVAGGVATYRGERPPGALSVAAAMPAGSVSNATPNLQQRELRSQEWRRLESTVTVGADARAHVRHDVTIAFPRDEERQIVHEQILSRAPWDKEHDQVFRLGNLRVTDEQGRELEAEFQPPSSHYSTESRQMGWLRFNGAESGQEAPAERRFVIEYDVDGAVVTEGQTAHLRLPVALTQTYDAPQGARGRWSLPGTPGEIRCLRANYDNKIEQTTCPVNPVVRGKAVTATRAPDRNAGAEDLIDIAFDGSALTTQPPPLQESLTTLSETRKTRGLMGGGLAAAALAGLGLLVQRVPLGRDQRFASVAPGVVEVEGSPVRAARRDDVVPVRFNPPDVSLEEAGLLMDRGYQPTHLSAMLVDLAVRGWLRIKSKPLTVIRTDGGKGSMSDAEKAIVAKATRRDRELSDESARQMRAAVESRQERLLTHGGFLPKEESGRHKRQRLMLAAGLAGLALLVAALGSGPIGGRLTADWLFVTMGLVAGAGIAFVLSLSGRPEQPLTARGTAHLDQVKGFRTYLATAEAGQLNYEADRDIFRRYLPWAVLFGLTERWTEVCQQLVDEGRIDPIDTTFWLGPASLGDISRGLSALDSQVKSHSAPESSGSSSSGGSGGSSGFSSGSSGGGGGGGTSASSW